jgi:hypothetical protein
MKIEINLIDQSSKILHYLELPKSGDDLNAADLNIRGWAYEKTGAELKVAIRYKRQIFITEKDIYRSDVEGYLQKKGFTKNIKSPHGFNIHFPIEDNLQIGFEIFNEINWIYSISINKSPNIEKFTEFTDLKSLLRSKEGVFENIYFHNADDWTKVIFLFNGALTPAKIKAEQAIFQRWSWAKSFRHPVLSIADPLTIAPNPIVLGWYLGSDKTNALPHLLKPIINALREINPQIHLIGLGSSGGGFAAIAATLTGHLNEAIAINPQTDAILFEKKGEVDAFLSKTNGKTGNSDLKKYDFSKIKSNGRITYLQNLYDSHHFDVHYSPFNDFCQQSDYSSHFNFIKYSDEKSGHNPPSLEALSDILGNEFKLLLK